VVASKRKKVAVVGGGIFGVTAAVFAARAGHEVTLFEANGALCAAASGINQYRLHRGYHYPRSPETARSAAASEVSFRREYGPAVIDGGTHLYAVAREGSQISADEFLAFCRAHRLKYQEVNSDLVNPDEIDVTVEVEESWVDPGALWVMATEKLSTAGVRVLLNTRARAADLATYDTVVVATYANLNELLPEEAHRDYQYEVCEKPVVELPEVFRQVGLVVVDGPFMCVDPFGTSGYSVLGNVVHAIHATNVGQSPEVPKTIWPMLNKGVIFDPEVTAFSSFVEHGAKFIPALASARHVGSMYTVRTVLPDVEATDERPTLVSHAGGRFVKIFSGKIGNCVRAAEEALLVIEDLES